MSTAPPFACYGGKTNLARRIVDLLPPHGHYVEPFAGSLAVLLAKRRSAMETVNDLDGDLMLFWRVLRDQPDELRRLMELTPHSRAEFAAAHDVDGAPTTLERARRVWVLLSQGRGSSGRGTGWRHYLDPAGSTVSMPGYLAGYARRVPACAHRLAGVSLECRDALDVIGDHGRHPDVLIYADPPHLGATRNGRRYRHEYASAAQHRDLAGALAGAPPPSFSPATAATSTTSCTPPGTPSSSAPGPATAPAASPPTATASRCCGATSRSDRPTCSAAERHDPAPGSRASRARRRRGPTDQRESRNGTRRRVEHSDRRIEARIAGSSTRTEQCRRATAKTPATSSALANGRPR